MPPAQCRAISHHNHGRGNNEAGQPEKRTERGLCLSRSKWQGLSLPRAISGAKVHSHMTTWWNNQNHVIIILVQRNTSRRDGGTCKQGTEIGRNGTTIAHKQGDPNLAHQHTLPSKWRRQRTIPQRILRYPNPKDGPMARGDL